MQQKYYEQIDSRDGKCTWKKSFEEELSNRPEEAKAIVKRNPLTISLFSHAYLAANREIVKIAIETVFEQDDNSRGFDVCVFESIPEPLLKEEYRTILKYVEKKGRRIRFVPYYFQEEYLSIPKEAVRNDPTAITYVSPKALMNYPDIAFLAVKKDRSMYKCIPEKVKAKYKGLEKYK